MPNGTPDATTPLNPAGAKQQRREALATLLGKVPPAETGTGASAPADGVDAAIVHLDGVIQASKDNCWSWMIHHAPKGAALVATGAQTGYVYWTLNGGDTAKAQSGMGAVINALLMADEVGAELHDAPVTWSAFWAQDGWGKMASIGSFAIGSHLAAGAAVIVFQPYQMMLRDELHLPLTPTRDIAGQAMLATQWAFLVPSSARGVYGLGAGINRWCSETPEVRQRRTDVDTLLGDIDFTITTGSVADKKALAVELSGLFAEGEEAPWTTVAAAAAAARSRPSYWLGWGTVPVALFGIVGLPTVTQANDIAVGIAPDKLGHVSMPAWGYALGPALLAARYGHPDVATAMSVGLNLGNGFMDYRLVERNLRYLIGILKTMLTTSMADGTAAMMWLPLAAAATLCGLTVAAIANQSSLAAGADSICFGNQTCPLTDGYKAFISEPGVAAYTTGVSMPLGALFNYLALFRFAMWASTSVARSCGHHLSIESAQLDEALAAMSDRLEKLQTGTATVFKSEDSAVAVGAVSDLDGTLA